jgi:uncharacterized protein YndB with AHSA1/START domain
MDKMTQELVIKRTFDAPRERVFKAWTDPRLVTQWWGPNMFTTPIAEVEAHRGGKLYIVMHGPKGSDFDIDLPMRGVFTEFDPPKKLVFTNEAMHDEKGIPQLATLCTVTFEDAGSKTDMTLRIALTKASEAAKGAWGGAEMGWNQSLDKLASFITSNKAEPAKKSALANR